MSGRGVFDGQHRAGDVAEEEASGSKLLLHGLAEDEQRKHVGGQVLRVCMAQG